MNPDERTLFTKKEAALAGLHHALTSPVPMTVVMEGGLDGILRDALAAGKRAAIVLVSGNRTSGRCEVWQEGKSRLKSLSRGAGIVPPANRRYRRLVAEGKCGHCAAERDDPRLNVLCSACSRKQKERKKKAYYKNQTPPPRA